MPDENVAFGADVQGGTGYQAPSAARALEASRAEMPRKPIELGLAGPQQTRYATERGPRYVLRTMQRDIAATIAREKTTLGSVALAEEKRRREREAAGEGSEPSRLESAQAPSRSSATALAVIGGVVLLIGALVAVFVIVLRPGDHPVAPMTPVTQTIIPIDGSVSPVTLSGLTPLSARARLREAVEKANTPINTLYAIPLVDRGELVPEDLGAITVELTTDEFIRRVAPDAPAALRRALNPAFTFGVHAFQGDTAFLAFGVQSFEQAFAEMLLWERTLELDLGPVFRRSTVAPVELPSAPVVQEATTTATSTSSVGTTTGEVTVPRRLSSSRTRQFTDDVIANHDVRVLRNERGEPFMLYTFPNRSTLFIAGSKATLEELLRRLTTLQRE